MGLDLLLSCEAGGSMSSLQAGQAADFGSRVVTVVGFKLMSMYRH